MVFHWSLRCVVWIQKHWHTFEGYVGNCFPLLILSTPSCTCKVCNVVCSSLIVFFSYVHVYFTIVLLSFSLANFKVFKHFFHAIRIDKSWQCAISTCCVTHCSVSLWSGDLIWQLTVTVLALVWLFIFIWTKYFWSNQFKMIKTKFVNFSFPVTWLLSFWQ